MEDGKGEVVVVVGAGFGIGKAVTLRLAAAGYRVACCDIDASAAKETSAAALQAGATDSLALALNAAEAAEMENGMAAIGEHWGRIDALVHSVGVALIASLDETSPDAWDRMINVNLRSTFLSIKYASPIMRRTSSNGRIVTFSSGAGKRGFAMNSAYCAAKFGVIGLTQSAAQELAPYGIRANAICPGAVTDTHMRSYLDSEAKKRGGSGPFVHPPMGRMVSPGEVADVVAFLLSPQAAYITGEAMNLTGGVLMY